MERPNTCLRPSPAQDYGTPHWRDTGSWVTALQHFISIIQMPTFSPHASHELLCHASPGLHFREYGGLCHVLREPMPGKASGWICDPSRTVHAVGQRGWARNQVMGKLCCWGRNTLCVCYVLTFSSTPVRDHTMA